MSFTVETGLPPVTGKRGRKPTDFPLVEMDTGATFLIECDPADKKVVESWRRKFLVAKKRFSDTYGEEVKFTTAVVNDDKYGRGLRIWRTQ